MTLDINSVAIIGAGPSGLAPLYELLHTTKDGKSTVGTKELPKSTAFSKIVAFEQNEGVGGVWSTDLSRDGPKLAPKNILDSEQYHRPTVLKKSNKKLPSDDQLKLSSYKNPIITDIDPEYLQWNKSPVYPGLYTNISRRFMRFSSIDYDPKKYPTRPSLDPLFTYQELHKTFDDFANDNDLKKYIRFQTEVVNLRKDTDGKWLITLRHRTNNKDSWYQEKFDAVIIASGHYNVPYIPNFKGLSKYIELNPKVDIVHSKYFRDPNDYKDKNVLIIGASVSALDIAQYIAPLSKSLYLSRRPGSKHPLPWLNEAAATVTNVDVVEEFVPETGEIKFADGSVFKDIDSVIISTGYHVKVPYYDGLEYSIPKNSQDVTSRSRIKHLYQNIFNIEDPTLAIIGSLYSPFLIKAIESQAAAVAGVWSGTGTLPTKQEQFKWEEERVGSLEVDGHLFHRYAIDDLRPQFVDHIKQFFPKGRPDPLEDDPENKDVFLQGLDTCKRLFFSFKNGEIPPDYVFE